MGNELVLSKILKLEIVSCSTEVRHIPVVVVVVGVVVEVVEEVVVEVVGSGNECSLDAVTKEKKRRCSTFAHIMISCMRRGCF